MSHRPKILAISGSTRSQSSNLQLIQAIALLGRDRFDLTVAENVKNIPQFDPDLLPERLPPEVLTFRKALAAADGVLICTPEYAAGVPGTLKNAIDWTVSSMDFSQKPVALITASTSGQLAHQSLLGTLLILESKIAPECQLVISFIKSKVNQNSEITDAIALTKVQVLIRTLTIAVLNPEQLSYLPLPLLDFER